MGKDGVPEWDSRQLLLSAEIRRLEALAVDKTRNPVDRDEAACRIPYVQARLFPYAAWYKIELVDLPDMEASL